MTVFDGYWPPRLDGPGRIEAGGLLLAWAALIALLGAGHENGFGLFQAPESGLYAPLITGGAINLFAFALVAFWVFPAWRQGRNHVGAGLILLAIAAGNVLLQTIAQSVIIAASAEALRGTPVTRLAVENLHGAVAILVIAVIYRAIRDAVRRPEPVSDVGEPGAHFVVIGRGRSAVRLPAQSVRFVQAAGNYLEIGLEDRRRMVYGALKDVMEADTGGRFIRIHRSWIVNLDAVRQMSRTAARLDDTELPVGARYADAALEAWNERLARKPS